jgi:hypothetical protein
MPKIKDFEAQSFGSASIALDGGRNGALRVTGAGGKGGAAHPPSDPLVEGTSSLARGSIATAVRSARASPLKQDSDIW